MEDLILYRSEWYEVKEYHEGYVVLEDEIGNAFSIPDKEIQVPNVRFYYD